MLDLDAGKWHEIFFKIDRLIALLRIGVFRNYKYEKNRHWWRQKNPNQHCNRKHFYIRLTPYHDYKVPPSCSLHLFFIYLFSLKFSLCTPQLVCPKLVYQWRKQYASTPAAGKSTTNNKQWSVYLALKSTDQMNFFVQIVRMGILVWIIQSFTKHQIISMKR